MRGLDRAGGKHDPAPDPDAGLPAAQQRLDAGSPPALEEDPQGKGAGADKEVRPPCRRFEIGRGGAHAPAPAGIDVVKGEPLARIGVEVVQHREPVFRRHRQEGVADRQVRAGAPDMHGARAAMPRPVAALVRLRAPEIGKQILERPAGAAHLAPDVVFARVAARVDHAVDGAGPAQYPALEQGELPVLHLRDRVGPEPPIEPRMVRGGEAEAGKPEQRAAVGPARFQQRDRDVRVLGQPRGDHGTGRPGADDEIVAGQRTVLHRARPIPLKPLPPIP